MLVIGRRPPLRAPAYIEAKSGRQLTFMVGVTNVPTATPAEFEQLTGDQAKMTAAIQQAYRDTRRP